MKKVVYILILLYFKGHSQPLEVDMSFQVTTLSPPDIGVYIVHPLQNNRIVLGGQIRGEEWSNTDDNFFRIYEDGSYDNSFQALLGPYPPEHLIEQDGSYYLTVANSILRFDTSGDWDPNYSNNYLSDLCPLTTYQFDLLNDNQVIFPGHVRLDPCSLMLKVECGRLHTDGAFDTTFQVAPDNDFDDLCHVIKVTEHNQILVGGKFINYGNYFSPYVCRLDSNGSIDNTFQCPFSDEMPSQQFAGTVWRIFPDGEKFILSGLFKLNGYSSASQLVRINGDGSLDTSFNNFNSINSIYEGINACLRLSDGGFLFGGNFSSYQGYDRRCIVKTDSNGFIDNNFFSGKGADTAWTEYGYLTPTNKPGPSVSTIVDDQNGRIYVGGLFSKFNGVHRHLLVRLYGLDVSVDDLVFPAELMLYPNPCNDILFTTIKEVNDAELSVYNSLGCLISKVYPKENNVTIDTSFFPNGIYHLVLTHNKSTVRSCPFSVIH